jgi:hypothetical protein
MPELTAETTDVAVTLPEEISMPAVEESMSAPAEVLPESPKSSKNSMAPFPCPMVGHLKKRDLSQLRMDRDMSVLPVMIPLKRAMILPAMILLVTMFLKVKLHLPPSFQLPCLLHALWAPWLSSKQLLLRPPLW